MKYDFIVYIGRFQSPPIVLLSKTAYGYDYRESQYAFETPLAYDRLKGIILNKVQGEQNGNNKKFIG